MDPEARVVVTASDQTSRAFASADKNLQSFARGALKVRSALAGFGVVLSGRAFASWMSRAIETTEAVGEQRKAIEQAQQAFKEFGQASDRLGETFATALTPAIGLATEAIIGLRKVLLPTQGETIDKQIAATEREINRLIGGILKFEAGNFWQRLAGAEAWEKAREEVEELRVELNRLYAERDKRSAGPQQFITQDELVALETFIYELNQKPPLITQQELVALESFIYELNQKPPLITEEEVQMINDLVAELNTPLAKGAMLTQEEWIDLESFIYDLNHMKREANAVAVDMGEDFRAAFDDWMLGVDLKFGDLLKKMAVRMATSALFKGLSKMFGGLGSTAGNFLSDFFGGFRANGGPLQQGKWYIAGEKGPEPVWGGGAGAYAMGYGHGGGSVVINQTNSFHGGDMRQQAAAIAANNARLKQEIKAEISDSRRRGRPI